MTEHTEENNHAHANDGAAAPAGGAGEDIFAVLREAIAHFAKGFKSQLGKQARRIDDQGAQLDSLSREVKALGERPLLPPGAAATLMADIDQILGDDSEDSSPAH